MEVALDPPPLGVRCRDDAGAGGPELLGLPPDLVERRLQLRVEPDVAEGEADLPGEVGEDALVALVERLAARRALRDDEPQELARVRDRGDPERPVVATLEKRRQPDAEPGRPGRRRPAAITDSSAGASESSPSRGRESDVARSSSPPDPVQTSAASSTKATAERLREL